VAEASTSRDRNGLGGMEVRVSAFRPSFKDTRGVLANGLALSYALGGYAGGLLLMSASSVYLVAFGVVLTAHAMFIAAYLLHEACHDAIFKDHTHNRVVGELMSCLSGGSYASYDRIRWLHLRHHRERVDVTCFDHKAFLQRRSRFFQTVVLALEWAYVPAVELLMHLQVIVRPFVEREQRRYLGRVLVVLLVRGALLVLLATYSLQALVSYFIAYGLLLTALAFFDAFHHTYELYAVGEHGRVGRARPSREEEQRNTFSNVISSAHPWLNVLALNFGYHNAHHERVGTPWYRLPALHRELFADDRHVLPISELVRSFHRHRVRRVFGEDYGSVGEGSDRAAHFVGAHGVSFLSVV
jgi:fatty acid desaturase